MAPLENVFVAETRLLTEMKAALRVGMGGRQAKSHYVQPGACKHEHNSFDRDHTFFNLGINRERRSGHWELQRCQSDISYGSWTPTSP